MHKTDAANNVAGAFVDKVPGVSPGTIVDAPFLNAVQDELCNFIEARGVTLAKGTNTQLTTALAAVTRVAPTMAANWTSGPSSGPAVFYYKDATGRVSLEGTCSHATDGDGVDIFTLPVGFRPPFSRQFVVPITSGAGGAASVVVFETGVVRAAALGTTGDDVDTNVLNLDGISFHI